MTNKDDLPQEMLPYLRKRLLELDEEQWANISLIQFKSTLTMLLVSVFLGWFGADRFMLGETGSGVAKLLTGGGCGIWWLIDLFEITKLTRQYNWNRLEMWL